MSVFEGVRVIDCSTGIAGPYATMFLADHGADVIKVEPPAGDPYRSEAGFQTFNRGKRSCVLDLESADGRERILALARAADVFVVDLTQDAARDRGLDYERLRAANPAVVYLSVPPYGERGPLVGRPASPALLQAASGMMSGQASYSGDPVYLVLPLAAYGTAPLAAAGVAAALYARERCGVGQQLEVSELAGALALHPGSVRSDLVPPWSLSGPSPLGSRALAPAYGLYEGSDGEWFLLGALTNDFFNKLAIAIGHPELVAHPALQTTPLGMNNPDGRELLVPLFERTFRSEPRDHWLRLFREADVPAQPVLSREQYFESEIVRANEMRVSVDHPTLGAVEMMGVPLVVEAAPGRVGGRAPLLGEHSAEVLAEAGAATPPAARESSAPSGLAGMLSGVKVLDLSSFIAGPVGPRHLAMMGADVLKVEPLTGDPFRTTALGFLGFNQGKRGIAIDLRSDEGRDVFQRMAADADVLLENYRPGVLERLSIGSETLRELNPRLIHLDSSGYGDDESLADAPGFDPLLQALSGAMDRQGGGEEPVFHSIALNDVMTPAIAAFGVCAALYMRERAGGANEGRGQRVRVSLARSGLAVQAAEFTRVEGARPALLGGLDFAGPSAAERWYRCADELGLFVQARSDEQRAALVTVAGVDVDASALAGAANSEAAEVLAAAFAARPVDEWVAALDVAGVPCNAIVPRGGLLDAEAARANGLIVELDDPQWGRTTAVGQLVHASVTPGRIERSGPLLSQHAREVLTELGYGEAEQQALGDAGAVMLDPPPLREIGA